MPKISVIVPVYNTEKYIERCLDSILAQNFDDYEIIVVNDGSSDSSSKIIRKYESNYSDKIKYFEKENGGLSDARNYGIKKATGDYVCFVDSDDYIDSKLFESLEKYILQEIEVIKYKCIKVNEKCEELERVNGPVFENKLGEEAFNTLCFEDVLIEPAWLYLFKKELFESNSFPVGKYHEDWAIIPFIVLTSKSVVSTDIFGYYYVQSLNSITRGNDEQKKYKRAWDMLEHYDNLIFKLESVKIDKRCKRKL